jgi:hypothetical protein
MKSFLCQNCGNTLFFNNDECLSCGRKVGYLSELFTMSSLEPNGEAWTAAAAPEKPYLFCANAEEAACNWLVPADDDQHFCLACRYNLTIPDLSEPAHRENWRKIENAKKYLFYSLTRWRLPIPDRKDYPETGLAFEFLADIRTADGRVEKALTGHASGLISINIAEADDAERESRRQIMGEPYRTLVGHFRHEIGHFYWDLLVRDQNRTDAFVEIFGDYQIDYDQALKQHYEQGPPPNWQENFISAYATSHPWEDFAETWAHCFHMVDGLETAHAIGISLPVVKGQRADSKGSAYSNPYETDRFDPIFDAWIPLTVAINSVNRSLGQPDLYPFVLTPAIKVKLDFVFQLICQPIG